MNVSGLLTRLSGALLCSLMIAACGPTIQGEYRADGFSKRQLALSGLVIGGVVSGLQEQEMITRSRWAEWLTSSFRDEHKFPVQSAAYLSSKLGSQVYQSMLNYYRVHGDLKPEDVALIQKQLPDIQYIAFARLLRNEVSQRRDEKIEKIEEEKDEDQKTNSPAESEHAEKKPTPHGWPHSHQSSHSHEHSHDDAGGSTYWHEHMHKSGHDNHYRDSLKSPAEPIKFHTYYRTIRGIDLSLLIYDLHRHQPAWSGLVEQSGTNSNQYTRIILPPRYRMSHTEDDWTPLHLVGDVVLGLVNDAGDGSYTVGGEVDGETGVKPNQYHYPKEKTLDEVLRWALNDFAEAIPRR